MSDKALGMLGLMKRAGAIEVGEVNTGSAAHTHKAVLIITAADASENAKKRADTFAYSGNVRCLNMPYTKLELAAALGTSNCSMAALTDYGFASALVKLQIQDAGDEYSELAELLSREAKSKKQRPGKSFKKNKSH